MNVDRVAERVARAITPPATPPAVPVARRWGTVDATNAGPPLSVDVVLSASTVTIPGVRYLASYSPTVGDVVVVDFSGPDPLVIGTLA